MNHYLNNYFSEKLINGFSFDKDIRADTHVQSATTLPVVKTGTTIVGVACNDCVVLGADTRATNGPIVADKDCDKIHRLSDNIFAAGAGTAADLDHVTSLIEGNLELLKLQMNRKPRVANAVSMLSNHLYQYQGYVGAHLIVAGSDCTGSYVYQVSANGCIMQLPFTSMGSGSLCARSILEARYRDGLTENECVELVSAAIRAGIYNDLYSGSNVNILIIRNDSVKHLRHFDTMASERIYRQPKPISFPIGTTPVISEKVEDLSSFVVEVSEVQIEDENME
ncbi:PUP1/proteasome subunit beta type 7 with NTN hydrolase fold [Cryptosporidium canis]|uniref:Proteasome subunit beta n=1 Tax=Cryptosporidium canis TaxID=195482 RepID=A0ABQ8P6E6_9CRYT|nr:PUP1/proteasome subunit beta type 7 with NTN hydrolase fold [Cryptosporidium canis]KAJ1609612.1 PUP1/proteasome subunit beta type 7 with NTN hydrolase fold [Cryptosporidium canis]